MGAGGGIENSTETRGIMDDNMKKSRFSVICSDIEIIFAQIPGYLILRIK